MFRHCVEGRFRNQPDFPPLQKPTIKRAIEIAHLTSIVADRRRHSSVDIHTTTTKTFTTLDVQHLNLVNDPSPHSIMPHSNDGTGPMMQRRGVGIVIGIWVSAQKSNGCNGGHRLLARVSRSSSSPRLRKKMTNGVKTQRETAATTDQPSSILSRKR